MTPQREAIYAALCATTDHPTAEELFFRVREQVPGDSLATVYNTLEMLAEHGLGRNLACDGKARYDATCTPHGHTRCLLCGAMRDLPPGDVPAVLSSLSMPEGFTPRAVSIEVEGFCACCAQNPDEAECCKGEDHA
jgi:Fur family peroxide stress response transcriptional regulator